MIYKNKKIFSILCSKDLKIRKRASPQKVKSLATASISTRNFIINPNKIITTDPSKSRQESIEGNSTSGHSPSSLNSQIVLLLLFLFITIFTKNHYFSKHETSTERTSHVYADLYNQISLKQHHFYHFFHRTRHKPGQPSSLPTIQPTGQPTGRPSSFHTSQPTA